MLVLDVGENKCRFFNSLYITSFVIISVYMIFSYLQFFFNIPDFLYVLKLNFKVYVTIYRAGTDD